MYANLYRNGSFRRPPKDLGWLLRNWESVDGLTVQIMRRQSYEAILVASLSDGWYYTTFASAEVLRDFLDRPVFRTLPIEWRHSMRRVSKGKVGEGIFKRYNGVKVLF